MGEHTGLRFAAIAFSGLFCASGKFRITVLIEPTNPRAGGPQGNPHLSFAEFSSWI